MIGKDLLDFSERYLMTSVLFSRIGFPESPPFPIIGVGGIHSAEDALEKLNAGASLIQIYTGFIYEGPGLMNEINNKILESEV